MPGGYFLKKWFFDILTEEGIYIYFYYAFADFSVRKAAVLDLIATHPEKKLSLHESIRIPFPPEITSEPCEDRDELSFGIKWAGNRTKEISFHFPAADCELKCVAEVPSPRGDLEIKRKGRHILWKPILLRGSFRGDIRIGTNEFRISDAPGYEDYLYSNVPPFGVPVRRLQWGRIHHDCLTIAFTAAAGDSPENTWSKILVKRDGHTVEIDGISVKRLSGKDCSELRMNYADSYMISARADDLEVELIFRHEAIASVSRFLDTPRYSKGIAAWAIRGYTRDPRGIKFFARVDVRIKDGSGDLVFSDVPCVDEYVVFD